MGQRQQTGEAGRVPADVKPRTIRLDDATWEAAEQAARARGLNSAAEFIRQATIASIAWDRAMDAVASGGDPEKMRDPALLLRAFQWIAEHPDA